MAKKYKYSAKSLHPASSVFVSANAGSGKTSLLTARVLALLLHGVPPSHILCLTFTKAAAAEMISRITTALGEWVMMDEGLLRQRLEELLPEGVNEVMVRRSRSLFAMLLDDPVGIRMQTIHAFCQSLLARFPLEAGVGTHLSVLDDTSQNALLKEARMQLFGEAAARDSEVGAALYALVQGVGEHNLLSVLNDLIKQKRQLSRFLEKHHGLGFARREIYRAFGAAADDSLASILEKNMNRSPEHLVRLRGIAEILHASNGKTNLKTAHILRRWADAREIAEGLCEDYCWHYMVKTGDNFGNPTAIFTKDILSSDDETYLREEQERALAFRAVWCAWRDARLTDQLITLGARLTDIYQRLKDEQGMMDFDDQIIATIHLLSQSNMSQWVMYKLDGGIDHVLVDEAQDTNPEQWEIVQRLTEEFFSGKGKKDISRSLFVVGDEKQSIYRFQGADPAGLATNRRYFSEKLTAADMPMESLAMTHSFRSAPEILQLVDEVFVSDIARQGMNEEHRVPPHQSMREVTGYTELWPIAEPNPDYHQSAESVLAWQVADEIAGWVAQGVSPGDVMVLVRRRKGFVYHLARALKRKEVPVAGVDRMQLLENIAVQDLLAFAQILLLPEDDLTLAALLKSPIFKVNEDALFTLCHDREGSLWQALLESDVCREAYELLTEFRAKVDYVRPYELFAELLDVRGYRKDIIGRMGSEYDEVLDIFLEQALEFERTNLPVMQQFLQWMQAATSEIKRDMEEAGAQVRIMTVHGAKGLQAKRVIVADTTSTPTAQERVWWHGGLPVASGNANWRSTLAEQAVLQEKQLELEQYHRLLYVALTRAEDMLVICGAKHGNSKIGMENECWYQLAEEAFARIGNKREDGRYSFGTPLTIADSSITTSASAFPMPLLPQAPMEEDPPRPLSPSQLASDSPAATSPLVNMVVIQRGVAIHRILQYLPAILDEDKRIQAALQLAATYAPLLDDTARQALVQQALAVMAEGEYADIFGAASLAEVPVSSMVEWKGKKVRVMGQIDRLVVRPHDIWIIDFKSGAIIPDHTSPPVHYLHQMALYRKVLQAIYPEREVRAALLWTALPRLDWIDSELLDEVPASAYI